MNKEDKKEDGYTAGLIFTHAFVFILGMFCIWQMRKCEADKSRDKVVCKVTTYNVDIKVDKPDFKVSSVVNVIKPKWTCSHNWLEETVFEKGEIIKVIEDGPE